MSLNLGHITLLSQRPKEVASFFSELLDLEFLQHTDEQIVVGSEEFKLKFLLSKEIKTQTQQNILIEFSFANSEELNDIFQKVQFLGYRHPNLSTQKAEIKQDRNRSFFYLKDPDARRWLFYCEHDS